MKQLNDLLIKAVRHRENVLKVTNALRLVNGLGDGLSGLLVDRYNRHIHIQMLEDKWMENIDKIHQALAGMMPVDYMILKSRSGLEIEKKILTGVDPQTVVQEHGLQFKVNLDDGLNCGLFLDMRHNRFLLQAACGSKKVLNCFSYTCAFGLHARAGKAREVVNIDISSKALERGQENYRLNGMLPVEGEFVRADAMSYLKRAVKKGNSFDVIILDPPSFARMEKANFQVKRDMPQLMALGIEALSPGGGLFVSTNYSGMSYADLEQMLAKVLNKRRVHHIERRGQDTDFCGSNLFKESSMVGLWVKLL